MKFFFLLLILSFLNFKSHSEIISNVEVKNNKRISTETIITYGKIVIGNDYNENDLNEVLKRLYKTNFFKNISISLDNNTLVLDIEENKIIQNIIIEGVKSDSIKDKILENIFLKINLLFWLKD